MQNGRNSLNGKFGFLLISSIVIIGMIGCSLGGNQEIADSPDIVPENENNETNENFIDEEEFPADLEESGDSPFTEGGDAPETVDVWYGLYVDATSYAPGDAIRIYSSGPDEMAVFRLVRLDSDWTEVARTEPMAVGPQATRVGSFLEYPSVSLSGRTAFTLEGWYHPTLIGGDLTVIAGQFGIEEAAAAIVMLPNGRLAGYVSDSPTTDEDKMAIAPAPGNVREYLDAWHHLAMSYDGAQVKLYIDGQLAAERDQTGDVAQVSAPFRIGARAEAPGDLTGIIDGRIDSWAVWPAALSADEIEGRRQRGLNEDDPAPNPADVELYLSFEGPYPSIQDGSSNGHEGRVYNHGNPGVAGVTKNGRAFRLNHDQVVDAGWQMTTELTIPADADSGMYAVQALFGPDFAPTQEGDRMTVRAIAIRPASDAPRAPIAVVLPSNTWLAYNVWPFRFDRYLAGSGITPRSRAPGVQERNGGNNSGYGKMGDHVSLAYFYGLHRPSETFSPMEPSKAKAGISMRAPNSMYLVQWLDAQGFDYDVYSDVDFSNGSITAEDYQVLMPNSHHEYWSDAMLDNLTQFLDDGGSVAAPAGNIFTWRAVYGPKGVMEVRKFRKAKVLGFADFESGIDGDFMGSLAQSAVCNQSENYYGYHSFRALGVAIHLTGPCTNQPFCYGRWETQNSDHWLWAGSGLNNGDLFGNGRESSTGRPTYAVGHESDTWIPGMPLPGLAPEQEPVILAEGTAFNPDNPGGRNDAFDKSTAYGEGPSCKDFAGSMIDEGAAKGGKVYEAGKSGTILYFPHVGGGRVLVIGASATPWALESDEMLSGLLYRALMCFAFDKGCGE